MRMPLLPILVLALPILEIAGFIMVGKALGLWATLGLLLLSSALGAIILRSGGAGLMQKMAAMQRDPARQAELVGAGFTRLLSGFLLLVPGFITSVIGLFLLIPGFGGAIMRLAGAKIVSSASFRSAASRSHTRGPDRYSPAPDVVDLDENEYSRDGKETPSGNSPWSGPNLPEK